MAMFGKPVGSAGEGGGGQRRGSDHSSIIGKIAMDGTSQSLVCFCCSFRRSVRLLPNSTPFRQPRVGLHPFLFPAGQPHFRLWSQRKQRELPHSRTPNSTVIEGSSVRSWSGVGDRRGGRGVITEEQLKSYGDTERSLRGEGGTHCIPSKLFKTIKVPHRFLKNRNFDAIFAIFAIPCISVLN